METRDIQIVAGLGNPGGSYTRTRHNIGFLIVEALARNEAGAPSGKQAVPRWSLFRRLFFKGKTGNTHTAEASWRPVPGGSGTQVRMDDREILLFRPGAYMNRSGEALMDFLASTGREISEVLVVVDDIDLPFGRLRLKASGGPGTHNGLKNICDIFGPSFPRLRFGIRGKERPEDLADYVLSDFAPEEAAELEDRISDACRIVHLAVREGMATAMNTANRRNSREA